MRVYRIDVEQYTSTGLLAADATLDIKAVSALIALKKALAICKRDGFLKSQPVRVLSLKEIVPDLVEKP